MMEVYAARSGALRLSDGPHHRRHRGDGPARQHAHHLHPGRQRRLGRRQPPGPAQRDDLLQQPQGALRRSAAPHGRARRPDDLQPLSDRLGACHGHAVPVDQADRLAFRRHAQRRWSSPGRSASRRTARCARSSRHVIDIMPTILEAIGVPAPFSVYGIQQDPIEGIEHGLHLRRREGAVAAHHAVFRDVRQSRDLPRRLGRRHDADCAALGERGRSRRSDRRLQVGTLQRRRGLLARRTTSPRPTPRSCASCSGCSISRPSSTTSCRSTTPRSSASTSATGRATSAA